LFVSCGLSSASAQSYIVRMRGPLLAALLGLLLPVFVQSQANSPGATFDTPIDKKVVDFGLSSGNPPGGDRMRIKLSCYVYGNFMVKEYNDEGMKGAEWLAIAPITGQARPTCGQEHGPGEKVFGKGGEWTGYYWGTKGDYVFFTADDGWDGGMPFYVYDTKTEKKVFEDSSYEGKNWNPKPQPSPFNSLRVSAVQGDPLALTYLRVVEAGCDLHLDKSSCWEKVRKKFDIKSSLMPACSLYPDATTRMNSSLAYPVQVTLSEPPVVRTVAGPVKCWPVD